MTEGACTVPNAPFSGNATPQASRLLVGHLIHEKRRVGDDTDYRRSLWLLSLASCVRGQVTVSRMNLFDLGNDASELRRSVQEYANNALHYGTLLGSSAHLAFPK